MAHKPKKNLEKMEKENLLIIYLGTTYHLKKKKKPIYKFQSVTAN